MKRIYKNKTEILTQSTDLDRQVLNFQKKLTEEEAKIKEINIKTLKTKADANRFRNIKNQYREDIKKKDKKIRILEVKVIKESY